jgi:hypothetical protein
VLTVGVPIASSVSLNKFYLKQSSLNVVVAGRQQLASEYQDKTFESGKTPAHWYFFNLWFPWGQQKGLKLLTI